MTGAVSGRAEARPVVSVVLPIRNEADHIEACLERLLAQDYPRGSMEIIIVDGQSTDGTLDAVRRVQARYPQADVKVLDNPARVVPPALNLGIRAARGDVIVRMDGHTVPATDYVSACVEALERSGAANAGGVISAVGTTPFGRAVAVASLHPLGAGDARYRIGGAAGDVDTVPFGAFRRQAFERAGLFDESLVRNQDDEMNVRLRAAGERVYLDPAIRATYTPRGTVRGLWSQYFQYGWWRVETLKRHPGTLRWRQLLPIGMTVAFVVAALLAPFWVVARAGLAVASVAYLAILGAVAWRIAPAGVDAPRVALAFAVLHFAYGFGFVVNAATGGRAPYRSEPARVPRLEPRPVGAAEEVGT